MTTRSSLVWWRDPTETAKVYTATFTETLDGVTTATDLSNATVELVCSLFATGRIDVTSGVQAPATGGIVDVSLTALQLSGSTAGQAEAHYEITFADDTIRCFPDDGATFSIVLK